ncbi:MAG: cell filamentation protein Fic [Chloroflexi bacterium]|nr:MAG: cell filamentation protein Fic [Chloroflexota bacterium]
MPAGVVDVRGHALGQPRPADRNGSDGRPLSTPARRVSGHYVRQPTGYRAYIPAPLPPDPPVAVDAARLAHASEALARLNAIATQQPFVAGFAAMCLRREAVLSARIEGVRATLADLLAWELDPATPGLPADVQDAANIAAALRYAPARLADLPLSLRLLREIHALVLRGPAGEGKTPGEFRRSQNWVGPPGATLATAAFVPPPPGELLAALGQLEAYMHTVDDTPPLVRIALVHAQFETVHPFLDGNGLVGRVLIQVMLQQQGVLRLPLLYLSLAFRMRLPDYEAGLAATREGDWERWLDFFLAAIESAAYDVDVTAQAVGRLVDQHRALLAGQPPVTTDLRVLGLLTERPLLDAAAVGQALALSSHAADAALSRLESIGIVTRLANGQYQYTAYLRWFQELGELPAGGIVHLERW